MVNKIFRRKLQHECGVICIIIVPSICNLFILWRRDERATKQALQAQEIRRLSQFPLRIYKLDGNYLEL